jgi:glycosyltransferase involved in cell wall biosynthesis
MVNPRRIKGGQTAFALAEACPDIPFVFVEAWSDRDKFVAGLRTAAQRLPNVTWLKPTTNMRAIYATTRLLLVPSEWEETWGRVVTEAHASGIPALASSIAALPESVGPGGILIEPGAPLESWVRALRTLWDDLPGYEDLCRQSQEFSARREAQPEFIAGQFLAALQQEIAH